MAKQTCLFVWVKRIFVLGAKQREEKKSRRWRLTLGRLRVKQYPELSAAERSLNGLTQDQRRHALNVAAATAAAADAAVAAARAAAEVVRLTGGSRTRCLIQERDPNSAATAIQSAFRAYLARKALRALKGLVKLQAIVRGRAVRRRTGHRIRRFPSRARVQSEVNRRSVPFEYGHCRGGERRLFAREMKHECSSPRSWNLSTISKEDMEAKRLKKQEAIMKRERMKQYSFSHRETRNGNTLEESALGRESGRPYWLEQWEDADVHNSEGGETLKSSRRSKVPVRNTHKQDSEGFYIPYSFPRRSFSHGKHSAVAEESTMSNSPALPTYMAATESARAKLRSTSSSKHRQRAVDTLSDHNLRCKHGLSFSSYNSDSLMNAKCNASQRISVSTNRV